MKSIARRPFAAGAIATLFTLPANALVKGSAPPPKKAKGEKSTCKTIDECEEAGRQREAAMYDAQNQPFQTTKDGVRWRDVREGSGSDVRRTKPTVPDDEGRRALARCAGRQRQRCTTHKTNRSRRRRTACAGAMCGK